MRDHLNNRENQSSVNGILESQALEFFYIHILDNRICQIYTTRTTRTQGTPAF